ncbi:hypothetical protein AT05_03195 [Schleiferia thermophila str. Yellowstone]|nr:hypothetical protein AT05_03195 [Schleiferia thermophila str. Yellowstone]
MLPLRLLARVPQSPPASAHIRLRPGAVYQPLYPSPIKALKITKVRDLSAPVILGTCNLHLNILSSCKRCIHTKVLHHHPMNL